MMFYQSLVFLLIDCFFDRNVAEWVRQTENAGVLETAPERPDSPQFSETCSFTTTVSVLNYPEWFCVITFCFSCLTIVISKC